MKKDLYGRCPFVTSQRVLQGKWSMLILHHLTGAPVRFNELQRRLPDMTHATLSKQLKQLEEDGLILRVEYPQIPPKVEYSLSGIGRKFNSVLDSLRVWGDEYIEFISNKENGGASKRRKPVVVDAADMADAQDESEAMEA